MKYTLYIIALLSVLVPTTGAAFHVVVNQSSDRMEVASLDAAATGNTAAATGEISTSDVHSAAVRLLEERFPEIAPRLQVRVERLGSKVDSAASLRIRLNQSESIPKGRTQVRLLSLDAGDGNSWSDAGWALLYVAHFDSVAIAQNDVPQDEPVSGGDITFGWMETTTFRGVPLRPNDYRKMAELGMFADRPLRSGEAVRIDDLRPAYAADTGQSLTMTYRKNGIELKLTCQAREPGLVGEIIRAYSPDTRATYKVELTGSGTATWKSTL